MIKISLTRVISHAFWQMWLAGCDMTQHYLLPPSAISLEALPPLLTPVSPCPGLPSSSPAPDGRHSGRTLAKADVFIFRRQNVLLPQMAVPSSKWQPLTPLPHSLGILTDRAGLLLVRGKLNKKKSRCSWWNSWNFGASTSSFRPGEQFFPTRPQSASQLTVFSRWAEPRVIGLLIILFPRLNRTYRKTENIWLHLDEDSVVLQNGTAKHTCIPGHISQQSLRIGCGSCLPHWRCHCWF